MLANTVTMFSVASVSVYKKKIELKIKIQSLLFAFRYRVLNM